MGLCQYGAYGRAKQGQNFVEILTAYYANLDKNNNSLPVLYFNAGPIISVKITQPGRLLCPSAYNCDQSIKNGTYVTEILADKSSIIIKDANNNTILTIPKGQAVYVYRR